MKDPIIVQEFVQACTICEPLMLIGSGLSINSYSEEEACTRQLVIALGRHVVSGEYFKNELCPYSWKFSKDFNFENFENLKFRKQIIQILMVLRMDFRNLPNF